MEPTTVYAKTEVGHEEISSRTRRLPARVRTMLIMVDGRRSVGELLNNSPVPAESHAHLETLVEGGFIAPVGVVGGGVAPAATTAAVSVAPPPAGDLDEAKRVVSRMLMEMIGPEADFFTGRVDDAGSMGELQIEAGKLRKMIDDSFSARKAEQFWEKVGPLFGEDHEPQAAVATPGNVAPASAAPTAQVTMAGTGDLKEAKRVVSVTLMEMIGPEADFFTGRVDDARSMAELLAEAEKLRMMINNSLNPRKAQEFWDKVGPTLA
ncbi:MAG TPA: hypothetical protein PKZ27_08745 [Rhodocyclaceae bacterium]|nr:hypothetical protein [Rhodocyclaceae bacterium]